MKYDTVSSNRQNGRVSERDYTLNGRITPEVLVDLGFTKLANGQFEMENDSTVFLCYFLDNDTVALNRMLKSLPLHSNIGYHHSSISYRVTTIAELSELLK